MPIAPTTYFGKERVFVDRETCIQAFRENIQNAGSKDYNVLFFHGIAGIGKSKLQKELQNILNEEYPDILWASIDLNTKTFREVGTFLITLRDSVREKYKAKFYLFNTIHAIYWKKLHPESPLQKENYPLVKEGGFFSKIIEVLDEYKPGSLEPIPIKKIFDIINNAPDNITRFFKEQAIDVNKLTAMEAFELERLLPGFFAADFVNCLSTDSNAYIFIDTYEAIWEGLRDIGSFHEKDEWIRDNLIPNMRGVSWVICGREKLLWVSECDPEWNLYLEQHPVDELPKSYCAEFLGECGIEDEDIRDIIIKSSEGVPYYLNLSVDTFEKTKKKRKPVFEDFGKTQPDIFKAFVKYLDKSEIRALKVLSAPNFWDRDLFNILMKKFDPGLPLGSFSELINFSFIKTDSEGRYSIHKLMRESLQKYQNTDDRENVHIFMFKHYNDKLKEIDIKAITKEYETALIEAFYHAKETFKAEDLLNWFIEASEPFNKAAFWQMITPLYEEMLQILNAELGPEHPDVATTQNNLASLYRHMGDYEKARSLYEKALDIYEKKLDPQHLFVATSLDNLAGLHESVGDYKKALPFYQRALNIREKALGFNHPDVAKTLSNFASLHDSMGEYEKALPLYLRALDIMEKVLGPQHPDVATTQNNLALLYENLGKYEKAITLYIRALEIRENVLGPQNPSVATTLNNLALLYENMGDYEKALPFYLRALDIREKLLGPQHPDFSTTLNNLASLYDNMGDYEKAISLYQRTIEIDEKVLGLKHPDAAKAINNLSVLYLRIGEYDKAFPLFHRALDISEKALGPEHPYIATILSNLASLHYQMGEYDKAIPLYQRSLDIHERVLGPEHLDVATTLNNLASLYAIMRAYNKALPLFRRALDIREKVLDPQHPDVATTLNNLALLYESIGAYVNALSLHQRIRKLSNNSRQ